MKEKNKIWFVLGLIILFGGLNLTILLSHLSRYFGIVLIVLGLVVIFLTTREEKKSKVEEKKIVEKNLGARLIALFTFDGSLIPLFPFFGIALVAFVFIFNGYFSGMTQIGSNDYIVLILAGVLISYNYIPKKYSVERDFALLFISFLFLVLVVPTTLYSIMYSTEPDTNSRLTYYFLSVPTVALVKLFGITANTPGIHPITGEVVWNYIDMVGPDGNAIHVSIALSCTGLYSVAIFISAFVAFISVEYSRFDNKVFKLLAVGIFLAWIANIIRMGIIIIVGRYYGASAMQWTHNNIGEIIFMIWVSIFWLVMFKYLRVWEDIKPEAKQSRSAKPKYDPEKKYIRKCSICETPLSPTIPAYLCKCGEIYHRECIDDMKNCTSCHRVLQKSGISGRGVEHPRTPSSF